MMIHSAEHSDTDNAPLLAAAGRPLLFGRYEVDTASVLGGLSRPGANAYAATDINEPTRALYAVVTGARHPVRLKAYHQTRQMQNEVFAPPLRIGSAEWPLTRRNETILIMARPTGQPLMAGPDARIERMPLHRLMRTVLPALADMLAEMATYHVAHRAIRPDNIFIDGDSDRVTVGECFSVPAGMAQPAVFEPLERAMCLPEGRGEGDASDDMFALGVTTLFLALGQNPVADIDGETVLLRRRQLGSYAAIVGKRRIPSELIQMMRALLRDEPADRWTIENLQGWLQNGRGASAPVTPKTECTHPFEFGERKYRTAATLAYGLAADWPAALEVVKSGMIDKWLDKALKDKRCQMALTRCKVSGATGPRTIGDDLLLARTLLALDPNGPLRYRDIVVMPDGVGALLASVYNDASRLKMLLDMLHGMLPAFWMDQKNRPSYAMFSADEALTRMLPLLAQQAAGFGVERVMYELNSGMTCQSPLVADANCSDVTQFLKALDRRASEQDSVFDRHVAAFLAARVSGSVDRDLNDISLSAQASEKSLAQLRLFTYVQSKSDAFELPGLCRFFLNKSTAILDIYRNVELRTKLAKSVRVASESGELAKMEKVLGNEKNRRWDTNGFNAARRQFRGDDVAAAALQETFATIPERSRNTGKQVGALAAGAMSLATSVIVLLTQLG